MPKQKPRSLKLFIDTNVVIDFLDNSREGHETAVRFFEHLSAHNPLMSEDQLTTIYYLIKDKKGVLAFLDFIHRKWEIVAFGDEVIEEAIELAHKSGGDFEDILQCLSAKRNGCDYIVTNDRTFFECGIDIVSVEDFLKEVR